MIQLSSRNVTPSFLDVHNGMHISSNKPVYQCPTKNSYPKTRVKALDQRTTMPVMKLLILCGLYFKKSTLDAYWLVSTCVEGLESLHICHPFSRQPQEELQEFCHLRKEEFSVHEEDKTRETLVRLAQILLRSSRL